MGTILTKGSNRMRPMPNKKLVQQRRALAADLEAYLASGKQITEIPTGASALVKNPFTDLFAINAKEDAAPRKGSNGKQLSTKALQAQRQEILNARSRRAAPRSSTA
jgi:hypothetical protein